MSLVGVGAVERARDRADPSPSRRWGGAREPDARVGDQSRQGLERSLRLTPPRRAASADLLPRVWIGDGQTGLLRWLTSRRTRLIGRRTCIENESAAGRPPVGGLFGGKDGMAADHQVLRVDESQTVQGCMRQLDFFA